MLTFSRKSLLALTCFALAPACFAAVELKQDGDTVRVTIDGQPFTEYHATGERRPYLYPVFGPSGATMTRNWPLKDGVEGEEHDHPHHTGLWLGHRHVNGVGFWENSAKGDTALGTIIHDGFMEVQSGDDSGVLRTKNKWVADGSGDVICTDVRTMRFTKTKDGRLLDFDVTFTAGEKDVVFGDDKDGMMAIRVAATMRVQKPKVKGEKSAAAGEGHIVNSAGQTDDEAWGKRADWCDYYGPVDGKTVGVAMFDHPGNPRHPTWWHVRTYGLFAANPFGQANFEKLPDKNAGEFKIDAGKSATFRYRFFFHEGDATQAKVAEQYQDYAKSK